MAAKRPRVGVCGVRQRTGALEPPCRRGRVVAVSPGYCVTPAVLWGKVNLSWTLLSSSLAARGLGRALRGPWGQKFRGRGVQCLGAELQDVALWLWVTGPHSKQGTIYTEFVRCAVFCMFFYQHVFSCTYVLCAAHMNYL